MLPKVVECTMDKLSKALSHNNLSIESIYLYGSIALGNFIEGTSDIDFIIIVREPLNESSIQAISVAHQEVENEFPLTDMMGAYILANDVGKPLGEMDFVITYYNKQVHSNGYGADINPITWWILKNDGIKVYGSDMSLDYDADIKILVEYVVANLNTYWISWINRLEEQLTISQFYDQESVTKQLDEAVEWGTLGMLRQLYTVKEHAIKSKVQAGHYGITTIPEQWHKLIYEAIHIKQLSDDRLYNNNEKRLTDLVALLRYIHLEANRIYEESESYK